MDIYFLSRVLSRKSSQCYLAPAEKTLSLKTSVSNKILLPTPQNYHGIIALDKFSFSHFTAEEIEAQRNYWLDISLSQGQSIQ